MSFKGGERQERQPTNARYGQHAPNEMFKMRPRQSGAEVQLIQGPAQDYGKVRLVLTRNLQRTRLYDSWLTHGLPCYLSLTYVETDPLLMRCAELEIGRAQMLKEAELPRAQTGSLENPLHIFRNLRPQPAGAPRRAIQIPLAWAGGPQSA